MKKLKKLIAKKCLKNKTIIIHIAKDGTYAIKETVSHFIFCVKRTKYKHIKL